MTSYTAVGPNEPTVTAEEEAALLAEQVHEEHVITPEEEAAILGLEPGPQSQDGVFSNMSAKPDPVQGKIYEELEVVVLM